jgi:benzaldehyde dehydrogenase (NAD)
VRAGQDLADGLPEGVFEVVLGGAHTGEALVTDPRVAMISFTGSTRAGRRVGELAGGALKRVSLELGGNNALIVLEDADVDLAASAGAWAGFLHQGQVCISSSRHLVHESISEQYAEALVRRAEALKVGDPLRDDAALGPIINERQLAGIEAAVAESVAAGARVRTGGQAQAPYYPATVLDRVTPSMSVFATEVFGPVAPIATFRGDDEAVWLANGTEYGLAAAVHSRDTGRAMAIADRLHVGMVHVNDTTMSDQAHVPFGGFGVSGNGGAFGGTANWEQFTHWQWITVRDQAIPTPLDAALRG